MYWVLSSLIEYDFLGISYGTYDNFLLGFDLSVENYIMYILLNFLLITMLKNEIFEIV